MLISNLITLVQAPLSMSSQYLMYITIFEIPANSPVPYCIVTMTDYDDTVSPMKILITGTTDV